MKIIATDIANLTDARYFAAWGVDGLAYNVDPLSENSLSPAELKEITEWVEGPMTIIKLDGLEVPNTWDEITSSIKIKNLILGPFIDSTAIADMDSIFRICTIEDGWQESDRLVLVIPQEISALTTDQAKKIKEITLEKEVYLDANFSASDLNQIEELGFTGIILKGGKEEKVGELEQKMN